VVVSNIDNDNAPGTLHKQKGGWGMFHGCIYGSEDHALCLILPAAEDKCRKWPMQLPASDGCLHMLLTAHEVPANPAGFLRRSRCHVGRAVGIIGIDS
jgi:hypothetical protein